MEIDIGDKFGQKVSCWQQSQSINQKWTGITESMKYEAILDGS
jgi:hypothetical protein